MDVKFTDTFFKSLKKIHIHNTWYYKVYEFIWYDTGRFFKNIWYFKKELFEFRTWDYTYNLGLLRKSLELTEYSIRKYGNEVDESRLKKCDKMKRAIEIIKNVEKDNYVELAEKEIGKLHDKPIDFKKVNETNLFEMFNNLTPEEEKFNSSVYKRSYKIEEDEWIELCEILKGQKHEDLKSEKDYDGSGMKGWWD